MGKKNSKIVGQIFYKSQTITGSQKREKGMEREREKGRGKVFVHTLRMRHATGSG